MPPDSPSGARGPRMLLPGQPSSADLDAALEAMSEFEPKNDSVSLASFKDPNTRKKLARFDEDGDGFLDASELVRAFEVLDAAQRNYIKISAFPPETQASLLKFDVSGDQQLDALEVLKAFNVYEEQMLAQEKGTVPFTLFAPEVQSRLEKFDVSGDRQLDAEEILQAFNALEHQINAAKTGSVPFSSFPDSVQDQLRELDATGDQQLDAKEILAGVQALAREKQKNKHLMWLSAGLLAFSLLLLVAMGGLVYEVIQITKETSVSGSTMTVKGSNETVQTASSEMALINGVLTVRDPLGARRAGCESGTCPAEPIKTAQHTETIELSSQMHVENLDELKSVKIKQGDSFVLFQVLAVGRYKHFPSRHGTVLVLYTHLGEVSLDGTAVSFHESMAGTFSRAGLMVDQASNRRLLGVTQILGMFNTINRAFANTPDLDSAPAVLPTTFSAKLTSQELCGLENAKHFCNVFGDEKPVDWALTSPESGEPIALVIKQELYSMKIRGSFVSLATTTKDQWPEQQLKAVQNETHKLSFQTYKGKNYYCYLEENNELADELSQRRKFQMMSDKIARRSSTEKMQVKYLGFKVVDDIYCQHYEISEEGPLDDFIITLYENYAEKKVHRIDFANVQWRFDELKPLADDEVPVSSDDFNMDLIFEGCDPDGIQPPAEIEEGILTDALVPEADWGTETPASRREAFDAASTAPEDLPRGGPPSRRLLASDAVCENIATESVIDFPAASVKLVTTQCADGRYTFRMEPLDSDSKKGPAPDGVDNSCVCSRSTGNGIHAAMDDAFQASGNLKTSFDMACCLKKLAPDFVSKTVLNALDKVATYTKVSSIDVEYGGRGSLIYARTALGNSRRSWWRKAWKRVVKKVVKQIWPSWKVAVEVTVQPTRSASGALSLKVGLTMDLSVKALGFINFKQTFNLMSGAARAANEHSNRRSASVLIPGFSSGLSCILTTTARTASAAWASEGLWTMVIDLFSAPFSFVGGLVRLLPFERQVRDQSGSLFSLDYANDIQLSDLLISTSDTKQTKAQYGKAAGHAITAAYSKNVEEVKETTSWQKLDETGWNLDTEFKTSNGADVAHLWRKEQGDCMLSFRGSDKDDDDFLSDATNCLTRYRGINERVHEGFVFEIKPLHDQILSWEIETKCTGKFIVTGHSLGGAMASIFAADTNVLTVQCPQILKQSPCDLAPSCKWSQSQGKCERDHSYTGEQLFVKKPVDYLFTFGAPRPSWWSPLRNERAADTKFVGARFRTADFVWGWKYVDIVTVVPPLWDGWQHPKLNSIDCGVDDKDFIEEREYDGDFFNVGFSGLNLEPYHFRGEYEKVATRWCSAEMVPR